ncbi:hypothetical protein [Thermotalea metallivorans]|nr:hypothetical protein [Thermotalea metallivorans]
MTKLKFQGFMNLVDKPLKFGFLLRPAPLFQIKKQGKSGLLIRDEA